jgi:hypothetical protein
VPYVDLKRCGNGPASFGKFGQDPFMKNLVIRNEKLERKLSDVLKGMPGLKLCGTIRGLAVSVVKDVANRLPIGKIKEASVN